MVKNDRIESLYVYALEKKNRFFRIILSRFPWKTCAINDTRAPISFSPRTIFMIRFSKFQDFELVLEFARDIIIFHQRVCLGSFRTIKTILFVPSITVFTSRYGTQLRFIGIVNASILSEIKIKGMEEGGGKRNDPKLVNHNIPHTGMFRL